MTVIPKADRPAGDALAEALVQAPALTRRLYPRGGFEGLEANALQVLVLLQHRPGLSVNDLAAELVLGQGTVSTALGLLEQRGYVAAKTDEDDRRRQRQYLTRSGRALVQRFTRSVEESLRGT